MKSNFKGLTKLKELRLDYNAIELIPNNTFEDLISLDTLSLRELISLNNNLWKRNNFTLREQQDQVHERRSFQQFAKIINGFPAK